MVASDLSECRSGQHGHAGLLEQAVCQLRARQARPGYVREDVERAGGLQAAEAGDRIEPADDETPAGTEFRDHRVDLVLRPGQRLDSRDLRMRARAAHGVDDQAGKWRNEGLGHDPVAQPPPRHRIGLREAVEDDRPFGHAGQ